VTKQGVIRVTMQLCACNYVCGCWYATSQRK